MTDTRFGALHVPGQPFLLPNAWDYATAAWLIAAGFTTIGTTSMGVAGAVGVPDGHGVARMETVALARRLRPLPCLYTVDIEGGFSEDPAEVAWLCSELAELGAVGVNIEDGRADGTLVDLRRQCELISTVKQQVPTLFLNARTDTYWCKTGDLRATIERTRAFVDAGADGVFVPAVTAEADIESIASSVDAPLNVLYLPGLHSVEQLGKLGVARISTGSLLFRAALHATVEAARAIRDGGDVTADVPSYGEIEDLLAGDN